MTATLSPPQIAASADPREPAAEPATAPRLLAGTEPLGQADGSGLKQAPFLIRRRDGQIVQLSRLLYEFAIRMDGRATDAIAAELGDALAVRVSPEQVTFVAEVKLAPLGLVADRDGHVVPMRSRNALLALRYRVGLLPGRVVERLAGPLRFLFLAPIVAATLAALLALDVWLGLSHRLDGGLDTIVRAPGLLLALLGATVLSLAIHELGHAAACRHGGARPGRIGVGLYLVWPVFFSDVTDTYRLGRAARLRTDLGGVYFNALIVVATGAAYRITGNAVLLLIAVTQQVLILEQFLPWMRLDGYHVISDLIGVPDLFARIRPILASLRPGAHPSPRVAELKRWARVAVTVWVLTAVIALVGMLTLLGMNVSGFLRDNWETLILELRLVGAGVDAGNVLAVANGSIDAVLELLPVIGVTLTYLMLCRGVGTALGGRHARRSAG